jgi:tetratricopeptide (TPR) repeat protein
MTVTTGGGGTAARRAAKEAKQGRTPAKSSGKSSGKTPAPPRSRGGTGSSPSDDAPSSAKTQSKKAASQRQLDPDTLAALEEERAFLLSSLRDLEAEHEVGDVDEVDYAALKDDYTARAAAVIRAIEDREELMAEAASERKRSPLRIAAIAAGVVLLAVVAGVLMAQASGRRNPGDSITGDSKQDTRNLLAQAQSQFGNNQYLDAIKTYDQVLQVEPANAEALTYKGWLLYQVASGSGSGSNGSGQVSQADLTSLQQNAQESLDQAVKADPTYPDAHIFRAIIARNEGRNADAAAELNQVPPDQVPQFMRDTVDQLRTAVGAAPPGSTPGTAGP